MEQLSNVLHISTAIRDYPMIYAHMAPVPMCNAIAALRNDLPSIVKLADPWYRSTLQKYITECSAKDSVGLTLEGSSVDEQSALIRYTARRLPQSPMLTKYGKKGTLAIVDLRRHQISDVDSLLELFSNEAYVNTLTGVEVHITSNATCRPKKFSLRFTPNETRVESNIDTYRRYGALVAPALSHLCLFSHHQ